MAAVTSRGISAHDLMALGAGGGSDKDIAALAEKKLQDARVPTIWKKRLSNTEIYNMAPCKLDTSVCEKQELLTIAKKLGAKFSHIVLNENLSEEEALDLIAKCPNLTNIQLTHSVIPDRRKLAEKIYGLIQERIPAAYYTNSAAYTITTLVAKM